MARRRRLVAEINVVPYIDVMLVLLIIFMVTAPLAMQEIMVDLPEADAQLSEPANEDEVLILVVLADGRYQINIGEQDRDITAEALREQVSKVIRANPTIRVMVQGDEAVAYGAVIEAMAALEAAGATSVGLMTEPRS
ncbi:protein TolR [Umboniibacter marinipuniceus]|uniref:Tol-Pal system protein TolR n=1 Tax=Umboniibacter marinipuniceus TaxID=569599 RepID=A0A3M0A2P3_9GAMM|nr:protein TolR [Umboniibacter marinipuniceus]RMA79253.1 cell division and transport-associated protein TolR [Umboniibacter marinipuniceus]